jgi:hypothetical protein
MESAHVGASSPYQAGGVTPPVVCRPRRPNAVLALTVSEFDPRRGVVTRVLPPAYVPIHASRG